MESAEHLAVKTWTAERLRASAGSCPLSLRSLGLDVGTEMLRWDATGPLKGVWLEDPVDPDGRLVAADWSTVEVRGSYPYPEQPPDRETYKSIVGRYPAVIFDVSVRSRGKLIAAIEIECTSANSKEKLEFCRRHNIRLFSLSTHRFASSFALRAGLSVRDDFVSRW